MSSRINEIIDLEERLKQETTSHIQLKADLSRKIAELTNEETALSEQLTTFQESISAKESKESKDSIDITNLIQIKSQLEDEITKLKAEIDPLEQNLTQLSTESSIIDSKIEVLTQKQEEQEKEITITEQKRAKTKIVSKKIQNEEQRLNKINNQIKQQKEMKNNLQTFLKALESIYQVISTYSPLVDSENEPLPPNLTEEVYKQIIQSKNGFDEAQTKFDPNNLVPFLVDADKSYQNIVAAFIKLCENVPDSLLEQEFSEQLLTLVNKGFPLNTRHLNAVQSMISKLEKGVEIAPLASFSNEIQKYFVENLTYLRITGIVLEPPPS